MVQAGSLGLDEARTTGLMRDAPSGPTGYLVAIDLARKMDESCGFVEICSITPIKLPLVDQSEISNPSLMPLPPLNQERITSLVRLNFGSGSAMSHS